MENPKIIINTDDIKEKEILSSYWKFKENFKYEFSARDISKKYLINIVILSQLAKEKSHFNLICSSCECVILSGNISRSEVAFFDYVFEDNIFCEKCKKDSYKVSKAKNQLPPDIILKNMSIATNDKVWGNLDSFEFEALNVISKAQSVAEVYSSLKSINFNNPNEIPWETLNFLEEKYLIWMKRNPMQNIMEFYLDDRLKIDLKKHEESQNINRFRYETQNKLTFTLQKSNNFNQRTKQYKGAFNLPQTIEFHRNSLLQYEANVNDDGTITITILTKE